MAKKMTKSEAALRRWQDLTAEERDTFRNRQANAMKRYWASMTPEERRERSAKLIEARRRQLYGTRGVPPLTTTGGSDE